ncbi:ABC transporter substrate-binding protein [Nodosilinea sp. LEGE 07088]|uniref:ABC transporter substrate-binding protein n=1 Tax=Nodosilinea sp. LEGE 07088 TaxID=2777968 RepID=UPI001D157129|nr:iron-siderophore ABC transporter substrate-binding protein [Nodosilinea sp. LEGE 07088]
MKIRLTCQIFVMGWLIASCAGQSSSLQPSPPPVLSPQENYRRTVAHAMGNTAVPSQPQRVVVLTNEATDMVLALGLTPVGAVKSWSGEPYYDYLADAMAEVPVVGDELQPSLEQIVALQPDLILGSQVRQGQIYGQLSVIAPTVFSETIGESWQDNLRLYGQALNRDAEAEKLLADWDARVAQLRQQFTEQDIQVSLVRFLPGAARVYLSDSFPGQIVQEVGLQRPPSQGEEGFAQEVSFEQIPQMEADALFYFTYTGENDGQAPSTVTNPWLSHPLWQQLAVVQTGNAHAVSDAVWTTAGGIQAAHLLLDDLEQYLQP